MQHSEARERVLLAAERLFAERGYAAVTVKDIAAAAGIHHASLYHHAPQGKTQLFVEVTERTIARHQAGIADAILSAGDDLRAQLYAIAAWMLTQPPLDMIRMVHSDVPALDADSGQHLLGYAYAAIQMPIEAVFQQAQQHGEIQPLDSGNLAGALFSMIQGTFTLPNAYLHRSRQALANEIIDVLLTGLQYQKLR
ncbi:MAG: TetR/AcrR family transcriptional regulator [bacterium]|nr:TetR/AcrR family transcriptional regulator [bacterium]